MTALTLRLDDATYERLRVEAFERKTTITALIRDAISTAHPTPSPTPECSHPESAKVMRGWTQVCTACGKGRNIG